MAYNLLLTLGVPLALFAVGVLGKRLSRHGWDMEDLYQGLEAGAAAFTGAMALMPEQVKSLLEKLDADAERGVLRQIGGEIGKSSLFAVFALLAFLGLAILHQAYSATPHVAGPIRWNNFWHSKVIMLGVFGNAIGFCLLVCFLLVIKKG